MAEYPDGEFLLPIFPLPGLVFFPRTRIPLHIFEPRYRDLIKAALEGGERFGIVLLQPGWESEYHSRPAMHSCGTLGIIEQSALLDDGRYNILVRGEVRFRILEEVGVETYRVARVVAAPELAGAAQAAYAQRQWLAELSQQYLQYLPDQIAVPEIDTVGLEPLTNALIMSLNLEVAEKQKLLEIDDLLVRAEKIGEELQSRIESLRFLSSFRREGDPTKN